MIVDSPRSPIRDPRTADLSKGGLDMHSFNLNKNDGLSHY